MRLFEMLTNNLLIVVPALVGVALGWAAALLAMRARIARAVAHYKARTVFQYQREIQRLRQTNIDLENQAKGLGERLERREQVMRATQSADVTALREELRLARDEIAMLRAGGSAIAVPPVNTPLRPSAFQDFVADPQVVPHAPRRSA